MSYAVQAATLRLNDSMSAMDSWQSYVEGPGQTQSSSPRMGADSATVPRQQTQTNAGSSSLGSRLISRKNPVNLFRQQRKPVKSVYSIDVPKDTLYLHVDHGKVSPVESHYPDRVDSPVSAMSFEDETTDEIKPPVPLKSASRGLFPPKEKRSSTVPRGFSAKAQEWVAPASRFSWTTNATSVKDDKKSPELPSLPEIDTGLRAPIQQQFPSSRFSWTTVNTDANQSQLPVSPQHSPDMSKLPEEPRSRFSWTTNNTSNVPGTRAGTQKSPRSSVSIRHQPPSPPPSPPSVSVLNRARPIARPDAHLNVVKRKPTPSEQQQMNSDMVESPADMDPDKDLPLSPPEMDSIDIITSLQAQINSLSRSRFNLEKAMASMEQMKLQSPLVADLAKRRSDREKMARLEQELSEVRQREHDLGMKLHRALKRRDQEEPSGLWVRRVTS